MTEGSFDAYMWQTLETKARFIQQVMNGQTSVRTAEDLDGGALTYAEIKAIASGNPAVMEKVKIDTEIRKLDQLRAAHLNQQHKIRLEIRSLPPEIRERQERIERLAADIARRDANTGEEFSMTVGNRQYSGKGAREQAAAALTGAVLSWRDDQSLQVRGSFRGFEILSRGRGGARLAGSDEDRLPELFIRGAATYTVQLNAENPVGTVQSIEHALRSLEKAVADETERTARAEKMLADYREQLGRPFEHEARLKELLARQAAAERRARPRQGRAAGRAGGQSRGWLRRAGGRWAGCGYGGGVPEAARGPSPPAGNQICGRSRPLDRSRWESSGERRRRRCEAAPSRQRGCIGARKEQAREEFVVAILIEPGAFDVEQSEAGNKAREGEGINRKLRDGLVGSRAGLVVEDVDRAISRLQEIDVTRDRRGRRAVLLSCGVVRHGGLS